MRTKLVVMLGALTLAAPALGQGGAGVGPTAGPGAGQGAGAGPRQAGGRGGGMQRMFDPSTVTTVSGEVAAVHQIEGRRGDGTHVDLKVADATYDVHLGPAKFLASKKLQLKQGDQVEVTGSKITFRGKPAIIAQSVKKGDATVTLRDAQGVPAWARRNRK